MNDVHLRRIAASPTVLARDLWPESIGRIASDTDDATTLPARRVVPGTVDELMGWLCVDSGSGNTTPVWVHPDVSEGRRLQLVLRLQGIVGTISLGPLGDWNGQAEGAPKAMQTMTLIGTHFADAFAPQVRALENIRDTVLHLLGRRGVEGGGDTGRIILKRRVFVKVSSATGDRAAGGVVLSEAEDPARRARRLQHMWRVERRVAASEADAAGVLTRLDPLKIKRGDLVDVAVAVQAVTMRTRAGRRTEVMFCPLHVVRLQTAARMKVGMLLYTWLHNGAYVPSIRCSSTNCTVLAIPMSILTKRRSWRLDLRMVRTRCSIESFWC
ncbi:hypothetical protein OH76DRAFT_1338388 [Lentinus brumalis]|uniref:Uncharacterized protein n=1 Tax=Lentinus brumalis TaxID=2498619 RepID=A0A371DUA2_9APHY|nr:hypothetical protein OH76DRAFT_1338388 [Polyporus brumalis]